MTVVDRIAAVLNGGGWKTSPQAADRAPRNVPAGPPPLSIAHQSAVLAVRLWL